jgi:hypothetical protein
MAEKGKKKPAHRCPPIPEGWDRNMTGPAWNGESPQRAKAMWFAWVRECALYVGKMPRVTRKDPLG